MRVVVVASAAGMTVLDAVSIPCLLGAIWFALVCRSAVNITTPPHDACLVPCGCSWPYTSLVYSRVFEKHRVHASLAFTR